MIRKNLLLCFLLLSSIINAQVINNFEQGLGSIPLNSAVYKNQTSTGFSIVQCNISTTIGTVFTPPNTLNSTASKASIVTSAIEPLLASQGITKQTVGPNGGKYALRLNNLGGGFDITSYTQTFVPTSKYVSFDYMAVLFSPHITNDNVQPFFSVRLLDMNNNLLLSVPFCTKATLSDLILNNVGDNLFYTDGYYCQTIKIPQEYIGQSIKIQFVVADCGLGGDVGMAYLDNIRMGKQCSEPQFGFIDLDQNKTVCNPDKVTVTGVYSAPQGTTYTSSTVTVLDSSGAVMPVTAYLNYFNNGTFSYVIPFPTPLPYGSYEIKITAIFTNSLGYQYILEATSTDAGADIIFTNNNPMELDIVLDVNGGIYGNGSVTWEDTGGPYTIEFVSDGYCCISSSPGIPIDGQIHEIITYDTNIYSVITQMQNVTNSKCFRIRVKSQCNDWSTWCCITSYGWYEGGYNPNNPNDPINHCLHEIDLNNLNPNSQFTLYPNPTTNSITITNSNSTHFEIYDYGQKLVKEVKINEPMENVQIDLSDLNPGIYVLKTNSGHDIKIIKD